MSENAWRLLQSSHLAPGHTDDGTFNVARARTWIEEARRLLVEADRLDVGLEQIGEVLIHAPAADEGWPSAEVAELIEELEEDELDHGIRIGLSNARGVTSRSLTDGGEQERTLAADFRQRAAGFRDSYPRVARILNAMAESYETDARREGREAERRRRGLDR